jgi:hypothetical protein
MVLSSPYHACCHDTQKRTYKPSISLKISFCQYGIPKPQSRPLLFVAPRVPERDAVLAPVRLHVGVNTGLVEVAPFVVGPHVGKVDERVHRERDAQTATLPRQRRDPGAGDAQSAEKRPCRQDLEGILIRYNTAWKRQGGKDAVITIRA